MGAEPVNFGSPDAQVTRAPIVDAGPPRPRSRSTGSLSQRMLVIAAIWVMLLLSLGGVALDRTMTGLVTRNFDDQLDYILTAMVGSAEIGPDGEVFFNRPLGDQRFLEPNSGLYWQVSGKGHDDFASRSLWDRTLKVATDHFDSQPHTYDSSQLADEPLRVIERSVILPGSPVQWRFTVAASRDRKSTRLNSSHGMSSRMPSSA